MSVTAFWLVDGVGPFRAGFSKDRVYRSDVFLACTPHPRSE